MTREYHGIKTRQGCNSGLKDITFIFTTILRPDCARRLIASIRRHCPALKVVVADQNPFDPAMDAFYRENEVTVRYLPFDSGVGKGRASLMDLVDTRYTLFGDDDFIFTERTDLAPARQFLDAHAEIGLVGGSMIDHRSQADGRQVKVRRRYEKLVSLLPEHRGMIVTPIDYVSPRITIFNGHHFHHCDMTLNWALCRTDMLADPELRWDPQFKSGGEHEDFFLQIKYRSDWGVVHCPQMICEHRHDGSARYDALRARADGWAAMGRKWGVDWLLDIGTGLRRFDDFNSVRPYTANPLASAQQLPAIGTDFLRLWHDGLAGASVSPVQSLREARARSAAANANLQRRIGILQGRVARLTAGHEKAGTRIAALTERNRAMRQRLGLSGSGDPPSESPAR